MYQVFPKMKIKTAFFILALFHVSGLIAILFSPFSAVFIALTPLNLIISSFLVFAFHKNYTPIQLISFGLIACLGFAVEALGVATGEIFGRYHYGPVLGWKVFETPLIIGVNWILLSYSMTFTWSNFIKNKWLLAFISAICLVLFDLIIEPVAIFYNLWRWETETVPVQNYVAWGVISFLFCLLIGLVKKESTNKLAPYLIITQVFFFSVLYLFS